MPNDIIVTKFSVQFGSYQCECDAQKNTHNKNVHALMLKYENLMSLATSSRTFAHAFVSLKRINLDNIMLTRQLTLFLCVLIIRKLKMVIHHNEI